MKTAVISDCGKYRYGLTRSVDGANYPDWKCLFVMLNPSTADANKDDHTIRRCMGYAKSWGFGELIVVNLFAVRATDPKDMMAASDPVGPENYDYVHRAVEEVWRRDNDGYVICAWGAHGAYMNQGETVLGWIENVYAEMQPKCLRTTKDGHPCHPLRLPGNLTPIPYKGRHHSG